MQTTPSIRRPSYCALLDEPPSAGATSSAGAAPSAETPLEGPPAAANDRSATPRLCNEEKTLGQYIPLLYHYNMLQDEDRVGAFRQAIEFHVRPGMHVVELGGGTGILASLAARCGAKVSCVERNGELVAIARRFVRDNGLEGQITVIHADASHYVPQEPADVVVCEMLHVGLLREKQAQVVAAFKRHHRQAHGPLLPQFLPEASILMAQPVHQSFEFAGYHAPLPMFQAPRLVQPRTTEFAALSPYANIAYGEGIPMRFHSRESVPSVRDGCVNALRFVTQNVLSIDMHRAQAVTWPNQCLVLPIETPVEVKVGESIAIEFAYAAGGSIEQLMDSIGVARGEAQLPARDSLRAA
ncbi:MAG: methyltransferase domain-containing protein [Novipirellula sp. JB048]